jgi:lysophospholipase L1-like esterase
LLQEESMRRRLVRFVLVGLGLAGSVVAVESTEQLAPVRIALVGDSTVASYPKPPADRPSLTGWGQVFDEFFSDRVAVLNHAVSGHSSKSFIREGLWQKTLGAKPDYVFIQFGHNDQPGKGERSTDVNTEYQDYLRQYVKDARAIGAKPVLVTSVARRTFQDGQPHTTLQPYADAMQKVGQELNVPVIDLHAASLALLAELGDAGSADLSPSAADRSHFSRKGARTMAKLVAQGLPQVVPALRPYLVDISPSRMRSCTRTGTTPTW